MNRLSLEKDSCSDSNDMINGHPVGGSRELNWRKEGITYSSHLYGLFDHVQWYYDVGGLYQGVYWQISCSKGLIVTIWMTISDCLFQQQDKRNTIVNDERKGKTLEISHMLYSRIALLAILFHRLFIFLPPHCLLVNRYRRMILQSQLLSISKSIHQQLHFLHSVASAEGGDIVPSAWATFDV